jgi:hypothetical protein
MEVSHPLVVVAVPPTPPIVPSHLMESLVSPHLYWLLWLTIVIIAILPHNMEAFHPLIVAMERFLQLFPIPIMDKLVV